MFGVFYTTKPVGEGTGLGLTIARSIVVDAGGRLEGEGRSGGGARFTVRLRATPGPVRQAARHLPGPPSVATRRRVLLIDDEPSVRRSLTRLGSPHHDVEALASAPEALRRVEEGGGERLAAGV